MLMLQRRSSPLRNFIRHEASGGILLMLAAAVALVIANSPLAERYFALLAAPLGPLSVLHWVNDVLMAGFFFLVGLEIKREFVDGHLASWNDRLLPVIAAGCGVAGPALVYLAIVGDAAPLWRGWAVPTATDIAFALGVLALLGSRVPSSLKLFLTTVAIVDDMVAVAIIAIAYTAQINGAALFAALLILGVMWGLAKAGLARPWPYILGAIALWVAVHASGVHATIAGVLAAMMIPLTPTPGAPHAPDPAPSLLHRLEHRLSPWISYGVLPIFAFANAGVSFADMTLHSLAAPLPLAILLGLFLGKQIGIFAAVILCKRLGLSAGLSHARWPQVYGVALLCGIGFTMSLFIGGLAFADPALINQVKLGVFAGSLLSALAGLAVLGMASRRSAPLP
jgi:NhaA family Na+:H+ antiporter